MRHHLVAGVGTLLLLLGTGSGCTQTSSTPATPVTASTTASLPSAAPLATAPAGYVGATALTTTTAAALQTAPSGETRTPTAAGTVTDGATGSGAVPTVVHIVEPAGQSPQHWAFAPATLKVKAGTSVVWTNTGSAPHTVTADAAKAFDSGLLAPQATFRFTPTQAGTIAYHCSVHPWMTGTLVVRP